jgi:hypothetical protein
MPAHSKSTPRFEFEAAKADGLTSHGGLVAIDALAREFGLWTKIKALALLDPRRDKKRGFSPELIVAQLVFSFCSGGAGLIDAQRLGDNPALCELLGVPKCADASTLGEWLRHQSPQSVNALQALCRDFVAWALQRAPASRVRRHGKLECFFDDTQIELHGRYFEDSAINYNGDTTYSWQTLWIGPFIADQILSKGSIEVSEHLPALLHDTQRIWEDAALLGEAHFFADSGSSAGKYLNLISPHRWSWSVSYNKWTEVPGRLAAALPESDWSAPQEAIGRQGQAIIEQHGWVRHQPGEADKALDFAVVRYRDKEGLGLWLYAFIACGAANRASTAHQPETARAVFAQHKRKGAKELGFSELLSDMDLHHPPCQSKIANDMFYTLGALAYNLLQAFKVLHLGPDEQTQRVRSIIRQIISVPIKLVRHANRTKARLLVPPSWLRWWQLFLRKMLPKRKPGRQPREPEAEPPPAQATGQQ